MYYDIAWTCNLHIFALLYYERDAESNENNNENKSQIIVLEKTQKKHFLPIYDSFASNFK